MRHPQDVKSSHPWIEAAAFEATSQGEVLEAVLDKLHQGLKQRTQTGGKPLTVVFDVDSTIFDVKPRTLRILREWAITKEARAISPRLCEWALSLGSHQLAYTLRESAEGNGYPSDDPGAEAFLKALVPFWMKRFFSHEYVLTDVAMPGAVEFAWAVRDAGALPIYLTGRDEPGMGKGTRALLNHWGFPLDHGHGQLILKPYFGMDDSDFKDNALHEIRSHTEVVALFDNEPANFHVFEKNFPEAMLVFLHSNCSRKEAKAVKRIYKIHDFQRIFPR